MKLLNKFILIVLILFVSFIINCSSPEPIKEIVYEDDFMHINCKLSHFGQSQKEERTYADGEVDIKNLTYMKSIIFNLENLYLVAGQDTSEIVALPSDPVTKIILDEIYRPRTNKKIKLYWVFNRLLPSEYLDSLKLFYKYKDSLMTERLIW